MDELLGVITGEGYECKIWQDASLRVYFMADADIDADGANGQHGAPAAYREDDQGLEWLANGGMRRVNGKVVCLHDWARQIVLLDTDNEPRVFPGGIIASTTWYRHPGMAADDPAAYVDCAWLHGTRELSGEKRGLRGGRPWSKKPGGRAEHCRGHAAGHTRQPQAWRGRHATGAVRAVARYPGPGLRVAAGIVA